VEKMKINSSITNQIKLNTKEFSSNPTIEDRCTKHSEFDEMANLKKQIKELQAKIEVLETAKSDIQPIYEDKKELAGKMIKDMNNSSDTSLLLIDGEYTPLEYSYCFSKGTGEKDRSYRKGLLEGKEFESTLVSDNMDSNEIFTHLEHGEPVFVKVFEWKKRYNSLGGYITDLKNNGKESITVKSFDDLNKVFNQFLKENNITREKWNKTLEAKEVKEAEQVEIKDTMKYDEITYKNMASNMHKSLTWLKTKSDKPINKIFCLCEGVRKKEESIRTGFFEKYEYSNDEIYGEIYPWDVPDRLLRGETLTLRILERQYFTRKDILEHYQTKELSKEKIEVRDFNDLEKVYNNFLKENNLTAEEIEQL
jgi:hypothetical protein